MRRRATFLVVGVLAAGVIALVVSALTRDTTRAFTLGVSASSPIAPLKPRATVCQTPIDVAAGAGFDIVTMRIGTFGRPGSPLVVGVVDTSGRVVASGRIPGGYPDITQEPVERVRLDRTVDAPRIAVCVRNTGTRKVVLYGSVDYAARSSTAYLDRRPLHNDITLEFGREPRSMASLVPRMLARASLFRFSWLGPWAYVVLAALLLVAAPLLLLRAITTAGAARRPRPRRS